MFRVLIVGAGGISRPWARTLLECEKTEIAGWVDLRREAAEKAAEEFHLSGLHLDNDLGRALAEVKPDFVLDLTIPEAHHDVTLHALAAGVPVLGEKPMAATMEQARAMVAASEKAETLYMVSQSRRYDPNLRALRGLIVDHVGPLGILNSDFYIGAHFGGFRDEMNSPLLLDMAIHTLDAARYLCGADPVSVYCEEFNPGWSWYKGNASATAIFEMTGGLRYTYRGSWCSDGRHTSWEAEWRAVGPNGTATWDGHQSVVAEIVSSNEGFFRPTQTIPAAIAEIPRGFAGSLRDFLTALETGATPMGECHDNIKSLAMVFAAIESAALGQRIPVVAAGN